MHLRRMDDTMDDLILGCLYAAINRAENITGQHFGDTIIEIKGVAPEIIPTGYFPIREIYSAQLDGKNVDVSDFVIKDSKILNPYPGRLVRLTVKIGYEELPFSVRAAILMICGKYVEHPIDGRETLPNTSDNILKGYRRWNR